VPPTPTTQPRRTRAGSFDPQEGRWCALWHPAPAAFRVRVWYLMSRWPGPRTRQPPTEGVHVAYPQLNQVLTFIIAHW